MIIEDYVDYVFNIINTEDSEFYKRTYVKKLLEELIEDTRTECAEIDYTHAFEDGYEEGWNMCVKTVKERLEDVVDSL